MGYEVHTSQFEGPLDLLLHLIEKDELDITQVALAQVTDEFLGYVEAMRGHLELDIVADFLVVAARLLWIKSKILLPKPAQPSFITATVEEEDAGEQLVRQLREYRRYKEAAELLRQQDEAGQRCYVQVGPPPRPQKITLDLSSLKLETLRVVAQALLYPTELPRPQEAIQRLRYSIVTQIQLVRERLMRWPTVIFQTLISNSPSRVEMVVTLQAVLELIKQRSLQVRQEKLFGEIELIPLKPPEEIGVSTNSISEVLLLPPEHQSPNP